MTEQDDFYRHIVEHSTDVILRVNAEHQILYANPAAITAFGFELDALIGHSLQGLPMQTDQQERLLTAIDRAFVRGTPMRETLPIMGSSSLRYYSAALVPDTNTDSIVLTLRDITEQHRVEERLQEASTHDPLTGLFNRRQLFTMGEQDIARARRYKMPFSLVLASINDLKSVNQIFGYAIGDHLLMTVSNSLQDMLRGSDYVARLGNNSFAIALIDATTEQAERVASRIRSQVDQTEIHVIDTRLQASACTAVCRFDAEHDSSFVDMLKRAESLLEANRYADTRAPTESL